MCVRSFAMYFFSSFVLYVLVRYVCFVSLSVFSNVVPPLVRSLFLPLCSSFVRSFFIALCLSSVRYSVLFVC